MRALLSRVLKGQMPPSGPLAEEEKQLLQQWIESGAPWTRIVAEQRAGLDWWSLQPLGKQAAPTVGGPPLWRPITDRSVDLWRLQQEDLQPSPPADRRTLIRRLCFDLTGFRQRRQRSKGSLPITTGRLRAARRQAL